MFCLALSYEALPTFMQPDANWEAVDIEQINTQINPCGGSLSNSMCIYYNRTLVQSQVLRLVHAMWLDAGNGP